MVGKIVALISCVMCAVPFFIISTYNKDSREPISFWSGDTTLKEKVKDIPRYNREMAELYKKCGIVFMITGVAFLGSMATGIILLVFDCTVGIYLVYRCYKRILERHS